QILFRIADSSVLPLAPVSPFVPLFLGFLQRYKPDAKLGTYYSLVLPYPLIFLVVWLLMLLAWYLVGLPIGPGIYPRLS
ncbi:AbgT family transporter, partial [Shigella sonnei]